MTINHVLHYLFNDNAADTVVADAIGGHTGTSVRNTSLLHDTPKVGSGAFLFNGTTDHISVALNLSAVNKLSIAFWAKSPMSGGRFIISLTEPAWTDSGGFYVLIPWTGGGVSAIGGVGGDGNGGSSWPNPSANVWHHYVIEMDRTATPWYTGLWIDGVPVALTPAFGSVSAPGGYFANDVLYIGDAGGGGDAISAVLDDIRLYDGLISQGTIDFLFNAGDGTEDENDVTPPAVPDKRVRYRMMDGDSVYHTMLSWRNPTDADFAECHLGRALDPAASAPTHILEDDGDGTCSWVATGSSVDPLTFGIGKNIRPLPGESDRFQAFGDPDTSDDDCAFFVRSSDVIGNLSEWGKLADGTVEPPTCTSPTPGTVTDGKCGGKFTVAVTGGQSGGTNKVVLISTGEVIGSALVGTTPINCTLPVATGYDKTLYGITCQKDAYISSTPAALGTAGQTFDVTAGLTNAEVLDSATNGNVTTGEAGTAVSKTRLPHMIMLLNQPDGANWQSQIRLGATEDWANCNVMIPGGATGVSVTAILYNLRTGAVFSTLLNAVSVDFVAGVAKSLKTMGAAEWTPAASLDALLRVTLTGGTPAIPTGTWENWDQDMISVTQYPTPTNTLVGAYTDGVEGTDGGYTSGYSIGYAAAEALYAVWEAARNLGTAAANIILGASIKIANVVTNGAFVVTPPAAPTVGTASVSVQTVTCPVTLPAGATGTAELVDVATGTVIDSVSVSGGQAVFTAVAYGTFAYVRAHSIAASLTSTGACSRAFTVLSETSKLKAILDRVNTIVQGLGWGWSANDQFATAWTPVYVPSLAYPHCVVAPGAVPDDVPDRSNAEFSEIHPVRIYLVDHAQGDAAEMSNLMTKRQQLEEYFKRSRVLTEIENVFNVEVEPFQIVVDADAEGKRLVATGILLRVFVNVLRG